MVYTPLLYLLTGIHVSGSLARSPIINVIHATHPTISYFPRMTRFGANAPFDPWDLRDYEDDADHRHSFRFIRNGRSNTQEDSAREIHFSVKGSAVYLYGAPKRELRPYLIARQEVCVGGTLCQEIEVQEAYSRASDDDAVLFWSMTGLDPSATHFFILRLIEGRGRNDRAMSLQRIEYVVESTQKTLHPLLPGATLLNRTVEDTDRHVEYFPRSCDVFGRCTTPWESKSFDVLTMDEEGGNKKVATETFMEVKTTFMPWQTQRTPQVTFSFMGSAVYVFGAPSSQITLPHAAQEICLDDKCEHIDLHEAYLNPTIAGYHEGDQWKKRDDASDLPSESGAKLVEQTLVGSNSVVSPNTEERSVLIWSAEGLKYDEGHQLVIRMIERNPDEGGCIRGMTIDFIMYTYVDGPPPPQPTSSPLPPTLTSIPPSKPSEEVHNPSPQPTLQPPPDVDEIFKVLFFIVLFVLAVTFAVFGHWAYRLRHTESVIASPGVPPPPTPQFPDWDLERAPLLGHAPSGYSPHPMYHSRPSFTPPVVVPGSPDWDLEHAQLLGHAPPGYSPHPMYHSRASFTSPVVVSGSRMAFHDHSFAPGLYHPTIQYPGLSQLYDIRNGGPRYVPVASTSGPFDSFHRDGGGIQ